MLVEILIFGFGLFTVVIAILLLVSVTFKKGYISGYADALKSISEMLEVKEEAIPKPKKTKRR